MSAAIYMRAPQHSLTRLVVGEERRIPLDALLDGLLHEPPDIRLDALATAYAASAASKVIVLDTIVIDPISEEIPLSETSDSDPE